MAAKRLTKAQKLAKQKIYDASRKDIKKAKQTVKVQCEICNNWISKGNISTHKKRMHTPKN